MAKVISINDDVYAKLKEFKGNKSFSEIIMEMLNNEKGNSAILKQYLGSLIEEEAKKLKDDSNSSRRISKPRK